jgi:hypothetical protein
MVMERRKTTTETKLYATLDDHYRMMFGLQGDESEEERPQSTRPVSWHPSSSQLQAPQSSINNTQSPNQDWSLQYSPSSRNSPHGSDFYSLSTRNSMYEPMPSAYASHRGSDESDYPWQGAAQQVPSYMHSTISTPVTEPLPWYLQQWAQQNQNQSFVNSHNGSADFLPIQHPTEKEDQDMEEDDGKELVGMGLYDLPDSTSSWNGQGKGLKLEETWQPPEDDEDDSDEEDDDASEASVEEPSPPLPPVAQPSQQLQLPVHVKAQTPGSMDGQSFFFDDDDSASKEWWYQPLKQTSLPVRDAGLGYGWL